MTGSSRLSEAERLLQSFGITDPADIDLEAIAFALGVLVRVRPLDGCEARIIGNGDSAIITINSRSNKQRQRFSMAHELGHWRYDRGKTLVCRADDFHPRDRLHPERVADMYAADLVMPNYLFSPIARNVGKLTVKEINRVANLFGVSRTAACIRLLEFDKWPVIAVCHGPQGRKWFSRPNGIPTRWYPMDVLDGESFAFGVLFGSAPDDAVPRRIGAGAWFDRNEAVRYEILEQTFRTGPDEVLTILTFVEEEMLEDQPSGWSAR